MSDSFDVRWKQANDSPHRCRIEEHSSPVEWEPLSFGWRGLRITRFGKHEGSLGTLSIVRNNQYAIEVMAQLTLQRQQIDSLLESTPGRLIEGDALEATDGSATVRVPAAAIASATTKWLGSEPSSTLATILAPRGVERSTMGLAREDARVTTDWFLNGPTQFGYTRRTERERWVQFIRRRAARRSAAEEQPPPEDGLRVVHPEAGRCDQRATSFDYFAIELDNDCRILVAEVPSQYGPEWGHAIAVEYHHQQGCIPSDATRDGVSEILGFLFGKHLLRVGTTTYDSHFYPISEYVCDPWGSDVIRVCSNGETPPIPLRRGMAEELYTPFVRKYLELREQLRLQEVVWTYFVAQRMPMGFELPMFATSLEQLMTAWFKSKNSKSGGVFIPKNEFDALTREELAAIGAKLSAHPNTKRIMRKLRTSYDAGISARFDFFFDEFGLPVGPGERASISARHITAHGGSHGEKDRQSLLLLIRGYQTLLNRLLLKLLEPGLFTILSDPGFSLRTAPLPD